MQLKLFALGLAIWITATAALRLGGQYVLGAGEPARILTLFGFSLPLCAWIVRATCARLRVPHGQWPAAAVSLLLPTLLLDPLSSAFFPLVFPNMLPGAAGAFGGWMLCCCAGGLLGATLGAPSR